MNQVNDDLWRLQCKNVKCKRFFDYFGRVLTNTGVTCTHCGKSSKHVLAEFVRTQACTHPQPQNPASPCKLDAGEK